MSVKMCFLNFMLISPCIVNRFLKMSEQDDTFFVQYFIPWKRLYMFRVKNSPIIRSSNKLYLQHLVVANSL
jgi:hypothetical protein